MRNHCLKLLLIFWIGGVFGLGSDLIRQDGQKGPEVVEAVVDVIRDNCIFTTDRLFLRRLAVIQSTDGTDPKTYRHGYHGGIWQINETEFDLVHNCPGQLSSICNSINTNLLIDWRSTNWKDLRKPLYSGLAATLVTIYKYNKIIPGDLQTQARIWQQIFAPGQKETKFTSIHETKDSNCDRDIDLVFIIDNSGSISDDGFLKMIQFMVKVVDGLPIGHDKIKVGVIKYASTPVLEFGLNAYHDKSSVLNAIKAIARLGGGTNTGDALRMAGQWIFTAAAGMRDTSSKVVLLVTDGASNSFVDTVDAATKLKASDNGGVDLFAIGVVGANVAELNAVASHPVCTHVNILTDFSQMDNILNEIQRGACQAKYQLTITKETGNVDIINMTGPIITVQNLTEFVATVKPDVGPDGKPTNRTTLVTDATCSVVYIYASFETTRPGSAFNQFTDIAVDGKPSVLSIVDDKGRPLYVTYKGRKLNHNDKCYNASFKILTFKGKPPGSDVVCRKDGVERECSRVDFQLSKYNKYLCKDTWGTINNPCDPKADLTKASNIFHPVDSDANKFIKCDLKGQMYLTQCPGGEQYNHQSYSCGTESLVPETDKSILMFLENPCAKDTDHGVSFHAHPTEKSKFIECDLSGRAWVLSCPKKQFWLQDDHTCGFNPMYHVTKNPGIIIG